MCEMISVTEIECKTRDGSKIIYKNARKVQEFEIPGNCILISLNGKEYDMDLLRKVKDTKAKIKSKKKKNK